MILELKDILKFKRFILEENADLDFANCDSCSSWHDCEKIGCEFISWCKRYFPNTLEEDNGVKRVVVDLLDTLEDVIKKSQLN